MIGVNIAGAEFGQLGGPHDGWPANGSPGYHWPSGADLGFYRAEGVGLVRIPFMWERMQPAALGPLDAAELARLQGVLAASANLGLEVIPDCHNYGRRDGKVASPAMLADLWRRLAAEIRGASALKGYGLMNEPHDMGAPGTWKAMAQAAITAIRALDPARPIFVAGDSWSSAERWPEASGDLAALTGGNLVFEAHCYADRDGSGTYPNGYDAPSPDVGVERLRPFLDWLAANKLQGFVGEFGVPGHRDARWLEVQKRMLDAMAAAGVDGTAWAGGAWWGEGDTLFLGKIGDAGNANWQQLKDYFGKPATAPAASADQRARLGKARAEVVGLKNAASRALYALDKAIAGLG